MTAASRDRLACQVSLAPADGSWPDWQAGDHAEIRSVRSREDWTARASEFRAGLPVGVHAGTALLARGHPLGLRGLTGGGETRVWPIASLRYEQTLDLILVSDNSDEPGAQIPQYLLLDLEVDLRIRPRSFSYCLEGSSILVADSSGLAAARALLVETLGNPRSRIEVLLTSPPDLATAALGEVMRSLEAAGRGRLELLPVRSGRREWALALRRTGGGRVGERPPLLIVGRPHTAREVRDVLCSLPSGAPAPHGPVPTFETYWID